MKSTKLKKLKDLYLLEEFKHIHKHDFFSDRFLINSSLYLPDIIKGYEYLDDIIKKQKKILIFGDKDVDGITSSVILFDYLTQKFPNANIILQNTSDGDIYGISNKTINSFNKIDPDLIILLDMGSSHIQYLKEFIEQEKKIIILDHHIPQIELISNELIEKIAFINPLRSNYVFDHQNKISTSGLVLKFIIGYELFINKIIQKFLIIKYNNKDYVFQNGYYHGLYDDESLQNLKIKERSFNSISLEDVQKYFNELTIEFFIQLLNDAPIEFGKYLTCLSIELRKNILEIALYYSSLSAIGIIADQVPLSGENRTIVKAGLRLLKYNSNFPLGYNSLLQVLGLNPKLLTSRDIGWNISPIINAAGRMGETQKAIDLLLEKNPTLALEKASYLIDLNKKRKEITKKNLEILENHSHHIDEYNSYVLFYHEDCDAGVSGIMASKMAEKYKKPAIWINPEGEFAKGSVRSWGGINVLEMLVPLKDIFVDLGGHSEAVGFSIEYDKIETLKSRLKEITSKYHSGLNDSMIKSSNTKNYIEFSIKPEDLGEDLINDLRLLEPFGPENPEFYFLLKSVKICDLEKINDKHLKFKVVRALSDIEFILWNAFPDILTNDFQVLKLNRWDISGNFEKNIFYPYYSKCMYRFYVKYIEKKENLDEKLKF